MKILCLKNACKSWLWWGIIALISTLSSEIYAGNTGITYFVSPQGNDFNTGDNISNPLQTITQAIELAQPGDTITLMSGKYFQNIKTVRNGTVDQPIRIIGLPGAVVKGTGKTTIADIKHSYIELSSFVIDGLIGSGSQSQDYRKKLVYVKGIKNIGVRGVKLFNMNIVNARDECIRLKYFAQDNEIANSRISHCGAEDFLFNGGGHNGEAIYIGTAPEQLYKNPTSDIDQSDNNWIHNNIIETFGSECIDIKEGSSFNLLEYNQCSQEKDLNVGGISIRGNQNVVRYNTIYSNLGAGIRLGGDTIYDGLYNDVYGNQLNDNNYSALKIMVAPQGKICDNIITLKDNQQAIRTKKGIPKDQFLQSCI